MIQEFRVIQLATSFLKVMTTMLTLLHGHPPTLIVFTDLKVEFSPYMKRAQALEMSAMHRSHLERASKVILQICLPNGALQYHTALKVVWYIMTHCGLRFSLLQKVTNLHWSILVFGNLFLQLLQNGAAQKTMIRSKRIRLLLAGIM